MLKIEFSRIWVLPKQAKAVHSTTTLFTSSSPYSHTVKSWVCCITERPGVYTNSAWILLFFLYFYWKLAWSSLLWNTAKKCRELWNFSVGNMVSNAPWSFFVFIWGTAWINREDGGNIFSSCYFVFVFSAAWWGSSWGAPIIWIYQTEGVSFCFVF